jgi:hypothetical protein
MDEVVENFEQTGLSPHGEYDPCSGQCHEMISNSDRKEPEWNFLPDQFANFQCYDKANPDKDPNGESFNDGCRIGKVHDHCQDKGDDLMSDEARNKPPPGGFHLLFCQFHPLFSKEFRSKPEQTRRHMSQSGDENGEEVDT